jgi:hypothetical protein
VKAYKRRRGRAAGNGTGMNEIYDMQDLGSVRGWQQRCQDPKLRSRYRWHEKRAERVIGDWKDQRSSYETHTDR